MASVVFFGPGNSSKSDRKTHLWAYPFLSEAPGLLVGPGLEDEVTAQGPRLLGPGSGASRFGGLLWKGSSDADRARQDEGMRGPFSPTIGDIGTWEFSQWQRRGHLPKRGGEQEAGLSSSTPVRRPRPSQPAKDSHRPGGSHRVPRPCSRPSPGSGHPWNAPSWPWEMLDST